MKTKNKKKSVLLIGGRSKAASMARSLIEQGYRVTAINKSYDDCMKLADIKGLCVIHGDGTKPYVLDEACAAECDIAIALTGSDADNLVACQLCKRLYKVKKTVSVVGDPKKTEFFSRMGVDRVVCAVSALTGIIQQQAFVDDIAGFVPVGQGRVQIIEVQINADSPADGKKLWEISLPKESIVGCILREDATIIPRGDTRVFAGDTLVVLTGNGQGLDTVRALSGGA